MNGGREGMLGSLVGETPVERDGTRQRPMTLQDDRAATFRRLVDRGLDDAYRLATIVLGDRTDAEDAVHDAVVAAWRSFDGLRDPGRFDAWFRRILVNVCRDRLRSRARRRVVDLDRELVEAEHPRLGDAAETIAVRDAVDRALDALGPDERLIVVLRYHADMTVPAIAAATGIPEGTVKSRLFNAHRRLRAALGEADR
jgi:RNA polymerase sigma-70 factor (ECF subfamily)